MDLELLRNRGNERLAGNTRDYRKKKQTEFVQRLQEVQAQRDAARRKPSGLQNFLGNNVLTPLEQITREPQKNIASFNERLLGGTGRGLLRGAEYIIPGEKTLGTGQLLEIADKLDAKSPQSILPKTGANRVDPNSVGGKAGTVAKGAADIVSILAPQTAADKYLKGTQLVARGGTGTKVLASGAAGIPSSAVDVLQQVGRGDTPNYKQSVGVGLAVDLAAPLAGKGTKYIKKVIDSSVPSIAETKLGTAIAQTNAGKKIVDLKDKFVAKTIDDTNMVKKQFKGQIDPTTGRKVIDEIEERVTNVRQFSAKAQDRLNNNASYQGLKQAIGGDKSRYDDYGKFISSKQDAINYNKLALAPVEQAKTRLKDAQRALESAQTTKQRGAAKARVTNAQKNLAKTREGLKAKGLQQVPKGSTEQEQAYELLNQATKSDIQLLYDAEKIDRAKYMKWMSDPDYTRVQREVLEDQQSSSMGGLIKSTGVADQKLRGSTKQAIDPFTAYEDFSRRITLENERQDLAKYIRDRAVANGTSTKLQTTDSALQQLKRIYGEEGVQKKTLPVFEKGIKELYTIDPAAARQLSGVADLELKAIADWALLPGRLLRSGATSMNPAFAVPNFIRDQVFSAVNSKSMRSTHNPIAFWQGIKEATVKPTGRALAKVTGTGDTKLAKLFEPSDEFKLWTSRNNNITSVDLARNLKASTALARENLGVKNQSLLRGYEDIISATEKATRYQNFFGAYKKALKSNKPPAEALSIANQASRENSINFTRRGEIAMFMKIFNPYINAGIQGSARLGRSLKERPVATSLKIGTTLLAPVATSTYYNLNDPRRAELYARIPQYERDSNLIMVSADGTDYWKLPLTPGMKEFANPLRNMIESEYLGDPQGFLETAKNLLIDPFNPLGTTLNETVASAIPQGIKPVFELQQNRNTFTGNPIVSEKLMFEDPENQVYDSTPQIYRDIAGLFGVSPLRVQHLVRGYTAGGGDGALVMADLARGAETGGRSTPEQLAARFAGDAKKLEGEPGMPGGEIAGKFYKSYIPTVSKRDSQSKQMTKAIQSGDVSKANELAIRENAKIDYEIYRLKNTYGGTQKDVSGYIQMLEDLKFPVEGGSLSAGSIKYRQELDIK